MSNLHIVLQKIELIQQALQKLETFQQKSQGPDHEIGNLIIKTQQAFENVEQDLNSKNIQLSDKLRFLNAISLLQKQYQKIKYFEEQASIKRCHNNFKLPQIKTLTKKPTYIDTKRKLIFSFDYILNLDNTYKFYSLIYFIYDMQKHQVIQKAIRTGSFVCNISKDQEVQKSISLKMIENSEYKKNKNICLYIELIGQEQIQNDNFYKLGWTVMTIRDLKNHVRVRFNKDQENNIFNILNENYFNKENIQSQNYYNVDRQECVYAVDPTKASQTKIAKLKLPFYKYPLIKTFPFDDLKSLQKYKDVQILMQFKDLRFNKIEEEINYEELMHYNYQGFSLISYQTPHIHQSYDIEKKKELIQVQEDINKELLEEHKILYDLIQKQKEELEELMKDHETRENKLVEGERYLLQNLKKVPFNVIDKKQDFNEAYAYRKWRAHVNNLKGVRVTFLNLYNCQKKKNLRVQIKVTFKDDVMFDDFGQKLLQSSKSFVSTQKNDDSTFTYEINYAFNFAVFISKLLEIFSPVPRNVTLLIRILNEKDTLGWLKFQLGEMNEEKDIMQLRCGLFQETLLRPPVLKSIKSAKKYENFQIQFKIEQFDYTLDEFEKYKFIKEKSPRKKLLKKAKKQISGQKSKSKKSGSPSNKSKNSEESRIQKLKHMPYIFCDHDHIDYENFNDQNLDFYIDQIRFMPDNATAVKILCSIVNQKLENISQNFETMAEYDSTCLQPMFYFKGEVRDIQFTEDSYLFFMIVTIDQYNQNKEVSIVGYAYYKLFQQKQGTDKLILNNGNYQIPVYAQPYQDEIFDINNLNEYEKIPALTILIRVNKVNRKNGKILNIQDFVEEEWEDENVFIPAQQYYLGKYNNSSNPIVEKQEEDLCMVRKVNNLVTIKDTAKYIFQVFEDKEQIENQDELFEDQPETKLNELIDDLLQKTKNFQFDFKYFAQYSETTGMSIAIDAFINPGKDGFYVIIYGYNPPGSFYDEIPKVTHTFFVHQIDWTSNVDFIRYKKGYVSFKQIPYDEKTHVIFTIKKIQFLNEKMKIEHFGFSILPVFNEDNYVLSGHYQIPIFEGELNQNIVQNFQGKDVMDTMLMLADKKNNKIRKRMIKPSSNSSLLIRIKDNWLGDLYQKPLDLDRLNKSYLPQNKLKDYAIDPNMFNDYSKKKMSQLLKKGVTGPEMNLLLKNVLKEAYDYGNDSYKILQNSQKIEEYKKIYSVPKGQFDFQQGYKQIDNDFIYTETDTQNSFYDYFNLKQNKNFLFSLHLDYEFQKNIFIKKVFENFFDVNDFQSGQIMLQPIATFLATKTDNTGNLLIIDSGHEQTYIIPIYENYILQDSIERTNLAGEHVSQNLEKIILKKFPNYLVDMNQYQLSQLKKYLVKVCPFPTNDISELLDIKWYSKRLILPDNKVIKLDREIFDMSESLFRPRNFGLDGRGIGEKIFNCIKKSPIDVRLSLMDKVVFVGGNASMQNFEQRAMHEFDLYWNQNNTQNMNNFLSISNRVQDKEAASLKGLYLASHFLQKKNIITKQEYQEHGAFQIYIRKDINRLDFYQIIIKYIQQLQLNIMYKNPTVTVDALVKKGKQLLLIQRKKDPFQGKWAFPGGHVDYAENPAKAVLRELKEETNLQGSDIELFNVYGEPDRDPRGHYITIVYTVNVLEDQFQNLKADDDAKDAKFHDIEELLKNKDLLAFDHYRILCEYFKDKEI